MTIFFLFVLIILTCLLSCFYLGDYLYGKKKLKSLRAGQIIEDDNRLLKVIELHIQNKK
jgi:hypothetical protein